MEYETQFIALFRQIAPHYRRAEVFYDFITLSALDLYQITYRHQADPVLRERFEIAKKRYSEDEFTKLAQLLAIVVDALTEKRYDFLGSIFMNLELGDNYKGQYFTPSHIADLMARITLSGSNQIIAQQGFITLSEPSCGSGVMVIGCINTLIEGGFNPQQQLWVECRDIDFTAAMICYIQLSLLHIPASIIVGDTLLNEVKIQMYTLAHFMGNWDHKLIQHRHSLIKTQENMTLTYTENRNAQSLLPLQIADEIGKDEVVFY